MNLLRQSIWNTLLRKKIGHETKYHKKNDNDKHLDHARRYVIERNKK